MKFLCAVALIALQAADTTFAAAGVPQSVEALWSDFDPRHDPLDARVVRQCEDDGVVFRYVTYHIGTFQGRPARMAAFYAFPLGGRKLPADRTYVTTTRSGKIHLKTRSYQRREIS